MIINLFGRYIMLRFHESPVNCIHIRHLSNNNCEFYTSNSYTMQLCSKCDKKNDMKSVIGS